MKNGLYAFKGYKNPVNLSASPVRANSWSLFFRDRDDLENWATGCDLSFKTLADMLSYMGISRATSLSEVETLRFDKLECIDCLYDLYVVRKPLLEIHGRTRLYEFSIFAYIAEELIGVMTGYSMSSDDIVKFYRNITEELSNSVCARSWRLLAMRTLPELASVFDLAAREISEELQDEILNRLRAYIESGEMDTHPCVLISDAYVEEETRKCGVFSHMIGALDVIFTPRYEGAFYLTPKKGGYESETPSLKDMRIFEDYSIAHYDTSFNVTLAKAFNMEVVGEGEERPIAILRNTAA